MSQFYIGQVMMTAFGFAQKHFAKCDGQILPIQQNQALFSLLGIQYGGDGRVNFALPDLRGRTPAGGYPSSDPSWNPPRYTMGMVSGSETVTLLQSNLPPHNHTMSASSANGTNTAPRGAGFTLGATPAGGTMLYGQVASVVPLSGGPLGSAGSSQPHNNMQPFAVLNFNIALAGIFPSRN